MTKGDLLKLLKPFTEELQIDVRMNYQVSDRSHPAFQVQYNIDEHGYAHIVLVGMSETTRYPKTPQDLL